MSPHPLKLDNDEIQRLLTQAYSETGYRLDRRDPIIVQYVVQKYLLGEFDEKQRGVFSEFFDRIAPMLRSEAKRMTEQKDRLWELARKAAEDVVRRSGEEYTRHINDAIRKTDNALFADLNDHIARLQDKQNDIVAKIREKQHAFEDAASQFSKTVSYLLLGYVIFTGGIAFLLLYHIRK